jgi:hypothetical protein
MRSIILISLVLTLAVTYVTEGTTVEPQLAVTTVADVASTGTAKDIVPPVTTTGTSKDETTGDKSSANICIGSLATVAFVTLLGRLFI